MDAPPLIQIVVAIALVSVASAGATLSAREPPMDADEPALSA